jgi:hypothetical protein
MRAPNSNKDGDPAGPKVVCILGAHRSGTSMFAQVLHACGLALGDEAHLLPAKEWDNPEGYWENELFVDINSDILEALGGSWSNPPNLEAGWSKSKKLDKLRKRAAALVSSFSKESHWGWKDPRTMLTLEFWQDLIPGLECVVVVRNPVEAALSLAKRPFQEAYLSYKDSLDLWYRSHRVMAQTLDIESCVVTHMDSLLQQPEEELARILEGLGWPVAKAKIAEACKGAIKSNLRHHSFPATLTAELAVDPEISAEYDRLCARAGGVFSKMSGAKSSIAANDVARLSGKVVAAILRDGAYVNELLAESRAHEKSLLASIEQTGEHVANLDSIIAELRSHVENLDGIIARLEEDRSERSDYIQYLESEGHTTRQQLEELSKLAQDRLTQIDHMIASSSWRITKPLRSLRG